MFRKLTIGAATALALSTGAALAEGAITHVHDVPFSFEGPFGAFDQMQLQRGLQVYTEVCASCHGMKQVPIRTLSDPGGGAFAAPPNLGGAGLASELVGGRSLAPRAGLELDVEAE